VFAQAREEHCRFCGASLAPEETYKLDVPFLERSYEVCRPCRDAWTSGGRSIVPFEPRFRADTTERWPSPLADDALSVLRLVARDVPAGSEETARALEALLARDAGARSALALGWDKGGELELALALAAAVQGTRGEASELAPLEVVSRAVDKRGTSERTGLLFGIYAHATSGVALAGVELAAPKSALARAHLEAARSAYLLHLSYSLKDEVDGRIAALHALASLELGDQDGASAKLRTYRRQADATPAARDPRIPLLQALVFGLEGNLAAVDDALKVALAWARAVPARWGEVEALVLFDQYVRAAASGRWEAAKDALKAFCKLRPDDPRALYDLGHTFMKCALDPIAREVLASSHERDPRDKDGTLLYATCLSRLGESAAAWRLLRDDLEGESPDDLVTPGEKKLGAERRHLAGLVAREEGDLARGLDLLAQAYALDREDDHLRANLVTLALEAVSARLGELEPEGLNDLSALLAPHAAALQAEYGTVALVVLRGFVAREIQDDFKTAPSFGIDRFQKLRFGDADLTTLQAYELLAQRRLGEAVRKDRQAQLAGGRPIPMDLLFRLLDKIRHFPPEIRKQLGGA
jgi:hypothetical protein